LGTNTLILTGPSTYTGATTVSAGKLLINGSTSTSSAVTVASGATLGGSGTVGGAVTIQAGGTFSPGNSIESIASGNLSLLASSTFAQEIDKSVAAGVSGDLTATTGTLSITSGAILTLAELGTSGAWTAGDRITLIGYSTGTWNGGLFTYLSNTLNDDSSITFSGINWTFNYNDTTFGDNYQSDMSSFGVSARYVTMTAVPEPRAALLGGIGMLLLLRRRRG
jgi:autotransporter-associated beta strand protein